jgi:hypothetical protein
LHTSSLDVAASAAAGAGETHAHAAVDSLMSTFAGKSAALASACMLLHGLTDAVATSTLQSVITHEHTADM